jgi:hypothetical protein
MFNKTRRFNERCNKSASEEFSRTFVDSGDFTYQGVEGRYTIYKLDDGMQVKVHASYNKSDVPWLDRDSFERNAASWLKSELSHSYYVDRVYFF